MLIQAQKWRVSVSKYVDFLVTSRKGKTWQSDYYPTGIYILYAGHEHTCMVGERRNVVR